MGYPNGKPCDQFTWLDSVLGGMRGGKYSLLIILMMVRIAAAAASAAGMASDADAGTTDW